MTAWNRRFLMVESGFVVFFAGLFIFALLDWGGVIAYDGFRPLQMVVLSGAFLLNATGAMIIGRPAPALRWQVVGHTLLATGLILGLLSFRINA